MATNAKKLVKSKSGLKIVALNEETSSPFVLKEPQWIPDNQCKACCSCQKLFGTFTRRHHCRRCGSCFCSTCCGNMVPLTRMCFVDPVRQCDACVDVTKWENDFFERHMKVLLAGGIFVLSGTVLNSDVAESIYSIKLSTDHRFLLLEGDENMPNIDPIDVRNIESMQILTSGTDNQGNLVGNGLLVRFKDASSELQTVKMTASDTPARKTAMIWIAGMQRAMKMIYGKKGGPQSATTPETPTGPMTPMTPDCAEQAEPVTLTC